MEDPEIYLNELGLAFSCVVDPSRPAILDAAHRLLVNHEVYFFSSEQARAAFRKDPIRWCGLVTDPVTGLRFRPGRASPRLEYEGRPYYFASRGSRKTFRADPARYRNPMRRMPEMPAMPPAEPESD